MKNLRRQFTFSDRRQLQSDISALRGYLVPLLLKRQGNACNICKQEAESYDIDHLVYNPKVTLNELQLLCVPCHKEITNFIPFRNRANA